MLKCGTILCFFFTLIDIIIICIAIFFTHFRFVTGAICMNNYITELGYLTTINIILGFRDRNGIYI